MRLRLYLSLAQILERNQKRISIYRCFEYLWLLVNKYHYDLWIVCSLSKTYNLGSGQIRRNIVINKHLNIY